MTDFDLARFRSISSRILGVAADLSALMDEIHAKGSPRLLEAEAQTAEVFLALDRARDALKVLT